MRSVFKLVITAMLGLWPLLSSAHQAAKEQCPITFFNLGKHQVPITTQSPLAQAYFDQGINWTYGFNHAEAERNFRKAAELDPQCGMCYWGIAYALGPNINAPMTAEAGAAAYAASQKALLLAPSLPAREQAYIKALSKRYSPEPTTDRSQLDLAFAEAMEEVTTQYPADLDAATFYGEALMVTTPWNYWQVDGTPRPATPKILATLERAMAANPNHPGANHFYIHVTESHHPHLAVAAAERLSNLVPDAGHLVHMPSHIFLRVGRYHEAVDANLMAIASDKRYKKATCHAHGFYEMMYVPHNYDFAIAAAAFEGRSQLAMQTAREMSALTGPLLTGGHTMIDTQQFWIAQMMVMLRFGKWEEALAWPEPAANLPYARGLWHYAQALASLRLGKLDAAQQQIDHLEKLAALPYLGEAMVMGVNSAANILHIGLAEAKGELLATQGQWEQAVSHLNEAVTRQDTLVYMEPPSWYHSVRLALGEVLLSAGRAGEAEQVFRKDLEKFPHNGWALFGLHKALVQQSKLEEAASVQAQFANAWQYADFQLPAARL